MNQRSRIRHRLFSRRGNVLVLVAVSLIALVAVTGLVIDGGRMMAERRHAQNAADAAALAGVIDLHKGKTKPHAKATALVYAGRNGYSNDGTTNTVTVNIPPASGPGVDNSKAVEVIANRKVNTSFIQIVYPSAASVTVRGVAEMKKNATLLLLNPTANGALTMSGSATINVTGGSVAVNSNHGTAIKGSGNAELIGNPIDITGNYSVSGSSELTGPVNTGATSTADPLAALPTVEPNSLPLRSGSDVSFSHGLGTLQPGRYMGKITLSSNAVVTMQPGIYYVAKEVVLSGSSSLIANGVMIYVVEKFTCSGNGAVVMSPPTSGTYKGVSLFQDRNSPASDITLSGGTNMNLSGTIYAVKSKMTISGNGGVGTFGSQIIADTATISGNGSIMLSGSGAQQGVYLSE